MLFALLLIVLVAGVVGVIFISKSWSYIKKLTNTMDLLSSIVCI